MRAVEETFDAFLKRREAISGDYISGDAEPLLGISPSIGEATFFPPDGRHIRGAEQVNTANKAGARSFRQGSTGHFEIFQSGSDGDLGFWSGLQHARAMLQGKHEPVTMRLRVTELFRRIDGEWKLVHRHADPIKD